jgi:hypothetical protein
VGAQGIAAEIPQARHRWACGIAAESPVFLPAQAGKKMRPNSSSEKFLTPDSSFLIVYG